ncbi:hypothetical protein QA635_06425 [Bradyrhizobium brasilense]|uniref:hypothetical protein n=1 Tax=Bradyrhizobium brasilense TaxID=1419277 RepID=UPI0024B07575|nr:hypothetical protein [Bradyrhizobium australafricanum]WFU34071.1 hypothetical protein QA635_06425 [Bradyrhizobium australafricanum]
MANNQHQNFGFGSRPQFTNESVPPSPTGNVVAGPLPGMLAMNIGDPMDILPNEAREKVEQMRLRREEFSALYRASFEDEQATRISIVKIEQHIAQLQKPRSMGGYGCDDNSQQVVVERRKLDRARGDLDRLLAAREPRDAENTLLGRLLQNTEAAVRARPNGTVAQMIEIEVPPIKGNILDRIEDRRRRGRELQADLARCRAAPWPSSIAKARMREQIEALAESGRPDAIGAVEHNEPIAFQAQSRQVEIHNVPGGGAIGFSEQPNSIGLIAWLFKDALIAALDREIDEAADDGEALTIEQRREREAEILADLLAVEREEVMLVDRAEKQGQHVAHRAGTDPLALLSIEWVPAAPPAAPEGAGEAGLVRHA